MEEEILLLKKWIFIFLYIFLFLASGQVLAEREIIINIPAFTLYLYEQGLPIASYPISIGTALKPSQLGTTTIINNVVDPTYYPPQGGEPIPPGPENPVGTRWLGLGFQGYGIHGTNNPSSIGSAASLGCIRMRNADVEELSKLVTIGTPVQLIYQLVVLNEDPLAKQKTITIYPDIYEQNVGEEQFKAELEHRQWPEVFWPALQSIFQESAGKPQSLAWSLPLRLNGERIGEVAVKWGNSYYLPFDLPFDPRLEYSQGIVKWGEGYYLPLEMYLEQTGLSYSLNENEVLLHSPWAYLDGKALGQALIFQEEVFVLPQSLPRQLMIKPQEAVSFWGEIYLQSSTLGFSEQSKIELIWPEGDPYF